MRIELTLVIIIISVAIVLLSLGIGYYLGKKRALTDAQHDYVMAVYYLQMLKALDEKKYDHVRDGIALMARIHVSNCRMYEKTLSVQQLGEIKKKIPHHELIENAEQLCGSLEHINGSEKNEY